MSADLERRHFTVRDGTVVAQRALHQGRKRRHCRAGGDRIGRVDGHEQRGPVAAPHRALEIGRDLDRK